MLTFLGVSIIEGGGTYFRVNMPRIALHSWAVNLIPIGGRKLTTKLKHTTPLSTLLSFLKTPLKIKKH